MTKTYMVIRNGTSKKTGAVYSLAQRLAQNKDTGFEWLDEKDMFWTDDIRSVGTFFDVEQLEVTK